jgi:hypothetical protein
MSLSAQACSGLSYCFAFYSEHLKETLNWSQTQIDGIGSSKDFGGNYGVLAGLLYNCYPPWVSVLIGASCNLAGYLGVGFENSFDHLQVDLVECGTCLIC